LQSGCSIQLSYGANYLFQNSLFNPETFPIAIGMLYSIELRGQLFISKFPVQP